MCVARKPLLRSCDPSKRKLAESKYLFESQGLCFTYMMSSPCKISQIFVNPTLQLMHIGERVQTFSYKMRESRESNAQHGDRNERYCVVYLKVAKRINLK